jgi:hypothetical protein
MGKKWDASLFHRVVCSSHHDSEMSAIIIALLPLPASLVSNRIESNESILCPPCGSASSEDPILNTRSDASNVLDEVPSEADYFCRWISNPGMKNLSVDVYQWNNRNGLSPIPPFVAAASKYRSTSS